jgi:hypothetical protein
LGDRVAGPHAAELVAAFDVDEEVCGGLRHPEFAKGAVVRKRLTAVVEVDDPRPVIGGQPQGRNKILGREQVIGSPAVSVPRPVEGHG